MSEPLSNLRRPAMNGGVPICSLEHCPLYDGKRCTAMGFRPDNLCEPEVEEMAAELRERRALDEHRRKSDEELIRRREADLSDADREGLAFAKKCVESSLVRLKQSIAGHGMSDVTLHMDALAALDRLLGGKP